MPLISQTPIDTGQDRKYFIKILDITVKKCDRF
jgi:hypothetical protein